MNRLGHFFVSCFLFAMGLFFSCAIPASSEEATPSPETIILISLDTTRADRLSCYGYEHETTPNIDAMAKESLFFEHPFATVPMTLPSHCSIFTGLIPPTHGLHENIASILPLSALTLPEILQQHGYATYGIVSSMVLQAQRGLNQGFDTYDDAIDAGDGGVTLESHDAEQNGKETTARALKWLSANAQKKKFMFIHYFDPHDDYRPPAPYDKRFKDPYDGEIAFTDHCVGQILDRLKALGLYDNALIALVGDHGEMLGEHGEPTHSFFIYQNALRVPMMFKQPGSYPARRIEDPCSLIDVTPTLLSMAGLATPKLMQGVDLSQYLRPGFALPNRVIYAESMTPTVFNCNSLLGIVMGRWHYIQSTRPELYDRLNDRAETNNLIARHPVVAKEMKQRLKRVLSEAEHFQADNSAQLDAATLEQLESLGYLDGNVLVDFSFDESKRDPKDMIEVDNRLRETRELSKTGKGELAAKICVEIMQAYPGVEAVYNRLVSVYFELGNSEKAVAILEEMRPLFPKNKSVLLKLATGYNGLEKYTNAVAAINEYLALEAKDGRGYTILIDTYMKQKSFDKALAAVGRRRTVLPDDADTLSLLGEIFYLLDDIPKALNSFRAALALDPKSNAARTNMAGAYLKMGNPGQALAYYEQALAQDTNLPDVHMAVARIKLTPKKPQLYDPQAALKHAKIALELCKNENAGKHDSLVISEALITLGNTHQHLNDVPKALVYFREALELDPKSVNALINAARIYLKVGDQRQALSCFEQVLSVDANIAYAHMMVTQIKLSKKNPQLYNPPSALKHAKMTLELCKDMGGGKCENLAVFEALAIAWAANGNFDEAIAVTAQTMDLCKLKGLSAQAEEMKRRIEGYKKLKEKQL